jgi:hypothetical protein
MNDDERRRMLVPPSQSFDRGVAADAIGALRALETASADTGFKTRANADIAAAKRFYAGTQTGRVASRAARLGRPVAASPMSPGVSTLGAILAFAIAGTSYWYAVVLPLALIPATGWTIAVVAGPLLVALPVLAGVLFASQTIRLLVAQGRDGNLAWPQGRLIDEFANAGIDISWRQPLSFTDSRFEKWSTREIESANRAIARGDIAFVIVPRDSSAEPVMFVDRSRLACRCFRCACKPRSSSTKRLISRAMANSWPCWPRDWDSSASRPRSFLICSAARRRLQRPRPGRSGRPKS